VVVDDDGVHVEGRELAVDGDDGDPALDGGAQVRGVVGRADRGRDDQAVDLLAERTALSSVLTTIVS
jgi:hypothetical protein